MDERRPVPDARLIAKELQLEVSSKQRSHYFHGESMRPFLVEGDEVVVEPVMWESIRVGDVITYRYLDRFPTRRVVRKTDQELHLWCENWPDRRFTAARDSILGRAIAHQRGDTWLAATGFEWRRARLSAIMRWRFRHLRLVVLPQALRRARRAPRKVLRMVGLLPPLQKK